MDLGRIRRLRAMFARLRAEGKLVHGGGSVELLNANDKLYSERTNLPKYTVKQSVHSAQPQDAAKLLARRMPTWKPEQHKQAGELFAARSERAKEAYSRMIDRAHWETFGKKYSPLNQEGGPLISGIISEKYPERWKTRLRSTAHKIGQYRHLSDAHFGAAKYMVRSTAQLNATRRARYGTMRDLGMKKTPYGWE